MSIQQVTEKTLKQSQKAQIALEKTFDRRPRANIWSIIKRNKIGKELSAAVESMYNSYRNIVS